MNSGYLDHTPLIVACGLDITADVAGRPKRVPRALSHTTSTSTAHTTGTSTDGGGKKVVKEVSKVSKV